MKKLLIILSVFFLASYVMADVITDYYERRGKYRLKLDYDGSNNVTYVGFAVLGSSENTSAWTIYRSTYSGTNMLDQGLCSPGNARWDQRTTLDCD